MHLMFRHGSSSARPFGRFLLGLLVLGLGLPAGGAERRPGEAAVRPATPASGPTGDYRIAPRDLLQFQIYEETDVQAAQRVSSSGEIGVPMLGTVRLAGLTLREAERRLEQAYIEKGYFVRPQVMLSVQTYAPRSVSVLGQVNKPERIDFPLEREDIGIVEAVTLAGGFTRVAKTDSVRVMRTAGGEERQFVVNVAEYLESRNKPEFKLLPDDVVFVPERVF